MDIAYPFRIDGQGRVADVPYELHIRQLIEQVLFTIPGERVNRPDFGCGLQQLIFEPNNEELATASEFLIQGSLKQWLGEAIRVEAVDVENIDSTLQVTIQYILLLTKQRQIAQISRRV
ncbi:GPW/gp25 family protein [Calothrix sp. NIES-2098]|uniref:GPW/gp25 family protein n=1 Tax=Calothrix sp. NIES-2098 TaxID=1954171 RepID=UPI000B602557|nr:hypothetical protein NIES2098_16950 [Calothrix sp. NIES-2098]